MSLRNYLPRVFAGSMFFCCSAFLVLAGFPLKRNVFDLQARRLSGSRVLVSWHSRNESGPVQFEVMRTFSRKVGYRSIAVVQPPNNVDSLIVDYRFVDGENGSRDTSFYCLKKTLPDGVVFYSVVLAVPGARNR